MAATYRIYRAPRLGDGISRATAFRSKLCNYITDDGTQTFWSWSNRATPCSYALALCEPSVHATIEADAEITILSPQFANVSDLNSWLDGLVGTLPSAVATIIEQDGFPVDWISGATTRRALFIRLSKWHVVMQKSYGDLVFSLFQRPIDDTVSDLPTAVRNRIGSWMVGNGLDTDWITGSTPIRSVLKYVVANIQFPHMALGIDL